MMPNTVENIHMLTNWNQQPVDTYRIYSNQFFQQPSANRVLKPNDAQPWALPSFLSRYSPPSKKEVFREYHRPKVSSYIPPGSIDRRWSKMIEDRTTQPDVHKNNVHHPLWRTYVRQLGSFIPKKSWNMLKRCWEPPSSILRPSKYQWILDNIWQYRYSVFYPF